MNGKMCAVRIPETLDKRYDRLARNTGRTKTFYMRQALESHIADMEDAFEASSILASVQRGEEEVIPFDEWEKTQPNYGATDE